MPRASSRRQRTIDASDAPRGPMPHHVKPMLATLTDEPFDRAGWIFEVKWDGFRAIAESVRGRVSLYSRNQKSLHTRFPPIVEALGKLQHDTVLDGEVVALDDRGHAARLLGLLGLSELDEIDHLLAGAQRKPRRLLQTAAAPSKQLQGLQLGSRVS
jgi:ATP-dependent DNA ligase